MNNTKPKDANKLGIVKVNKAEKYSEEKVRCLKMVDIEIYISLMNSMMIKEDGLLTISGVKIHTGKIES